MNMTLLYYLFLIKKHLIIHRDGKFQDKELNLLDSLIPELKNAGVEQLDAVEILKSGYGRVGEWNPESSQYENPRRGWAFAISENEGFSPLLLTATS